MIGRIRFCRECSKYTMAGICPYCGVQTENTIPPRYSPEDRFGRYRRMALYGVHEKE